MNQTLKRATDVKEAYQNHPSVKRTAVIFVIFHHHSAHSNATQEPNKQLSGKPHSENSRENLHGNQRVCFDWLPTQTRERRPPPPKSWQFVMLMDNLLITPFHVVMGTGFVGGWGWLPHTWKVTGSRKWCFVK